MTTEGNGQPLSYRLDLSEKVALEIKRLKEQADQQGLSEAFINAWRAIVRRLESDPVGFGELVARFPHLQQFVHVGSIPPLTVRFSYHPELHLVYVLKLFLQAPPSAG